jgi:hypothetical protein
MLYNPSKVKPTSGQMESGGFTTRYEEADFDDESLFLIPDGGKTVDNIIYNVFESWDPMTSSDVVMKVTLTKNEQNL